MFGDSIVRTVDPRVAARVNVFLGATLHSRGQSFRVRIRNICVDGALLEAQNPPIEGSVVRLRRGELAAECEVAWAREDRCGVRFGTAIDVAQWAKRIGHAAQERVDAAIQAIRCSETSPSQGGALSMVDPSAETITQLSASLDAVCDRIATWSNLDVILAEELCRLEYIARRLRAWSQED